MRRFKLLCVSLVLILLFSYMDAGVASGAAFIKEEQKSVRSIEKKVYSSAKLENDFDENHVIVILSNTASLSKFQYSIADFSEVDFKSISNLTQATTDMVSAKISGEQTAKPRGTSSEHVTFSDYYDINIEHFNQVLLLELAEPGKEKVLSAINELENRADVLYAGPNYYYTIKTNDMPSSSYSLHPFDDFNDKQWAIDKINLLGAWDIATGGDRKVTIGIIDEGIDASHTDLAGTVNIGKSREIDVFGTARTVTSVTDTTGHGTRIAGIIGARTFNSTGISGVNWNAELVSLKLVRNEYGKSSVAAMAVAIQQAQSQGVQILNISVYLPLSVGDTESMIMLETVANQYTGLIVCAAGNSCTDIDETNTMVPMCLDIDNMIVVGASTKLDYAWYSSNYGNLKVDLFAPGVEILSTYPTALCGGDACTSDEHYSYGYHYGSGTSLSAPYVAGVASLIMSKYPNLTVAEVKTRILYSVDVSSSFVGKCATDGRLNAYKALHNHTLTVSCEYIDTTHHKGYCVCGAYDYVTHTWAEMDDYWYCTGCGYRQY